MTVVVVGGSAESIKMETVEQKFAFVLVFCYLSGGRRESGAEISTLHGNVFVVLRGSLYLVVAHCLVCRSG